MHTPDLHLLALELEARGFVGQDAALDAVARSSRAAGLSAILIDVLGDSDAPEVARLRAYGRLASGLLHGAHAPRSTGLRRFRRAA